MSLARSTSRVRLIGLAVAMTMFAWSSMAVSAPRILLHFYDETIYPDHVLQSGETVTVTVTASNVDQPWTDIDWSLEQANDAPFSWSETSGTIAEIPAGEGPFEIFTLTLEGGDVGVIRDRAPITLTLQDLDKSSVTQHYISLNRPEILVISDGMPNVRETVAYDLEQAGVVWGYAGAPIPELPDDMYGALVIMVEVHGRQSQYMFNGDLDLPVRDWFRYGQGGSITGLYLHEVYWEGDPSWLGGVAAEWPDSAEGTVFTGVPGDTITGGGTAVSLVEDGISVCYPCCGTLPNMFSDQDESVSAWADFGWRWLNLGFSLVYLEPENADLTRGEFIDRIGNYLLYRPTDVADEPGDTPGLLPASPTLHAWPNPFNARLTIELDGIRGSDPSVGVFDINGRLIKRLTSQDAPQDPVRLVWDANDVPSGTYFLRAEGVSSLPPTRVVLVK